MATTTTNLSLRKPESSDYVSVSLDVAGNMQTIDDKWATSAAANIGSAAAAGSALTVARTDHVHAVGSGTVSAPGLPVGEANTGLYRSGTGQLAATIAGVLGWITSSAGLALEAALSLKHISTPAAAAAGYLKLYAKSDNNVYKQTPAGDEVLLLDADIVTGAGQILYSTAAEAISPLAAGTARQALQMNSVATAPEWVASPASLMTAQGDLLYASAANTPARFAKGTTRQLLVMNAGATAPEWFTPPHAQVYNNAAISIADSTFTTLTFNSENYDSDGIHSTSSNTDRLTCVTPGLYIAFANVQYASNATGFRLVQINHSTTVSPIGSQWQVAVSGNVTIVSVSAPVRMTAGSYLTCLVFQNSGGALDVQRSADYSPNFGMVWVGP